MSVSIVSIACRYPDASTPEDLLRNVLDGRRSFRPMPPARLDLARYASRQVGERDSIVPVKAGLIADWSFDKARFKIPQQTFEATDLAHWLALDTAARAIEQIDLAHIDRARTAVVVANTLTGEFSRAAMLRLRLPFLDDLLAEAVAATQIGEAVSLDIRREFASRLRKCFPEPREDMLAGGLANTIAGRIANFFDFRGGAYIVDGACASSLLALANAADLLVQERVDAVVVGAVDLSLDPFELVGFSRNGALARDEMRVFDARSCGFWPGEGAGFAVMMRPDDARRRGLPIRATLRGWGLSTDGAGGMTRPSVEGQVLALERACRQADVDPCDIGYVEAHGTGAPISTRSPTAVPVPCAST